VDVSGGSIQLTHGDIGLFAPTIEANEKSILTTYSKGDTNAVIDLLNTMTHFEASFVLLLAFVTLLLMYIARYQFKCEKTTSICNLLWWFWPFTLMHSTNFKKFHPKFRLILICHFLALILTSWYLCNTVKIELVTEKRELINSLEDILKYPHVRPIWIDQSRTMTKFQYPLKPNSIYAQVWKKAGQMGIEKSIIKRNAMSFRKFVKKNVLNSDNALISEFYYIEVAVSMLCQKIQSMNATTIPQVAPTTFAPSMAGHLMRRSVNPYIRKKIDRM